MEQLGSLLNAIAALAWPIVVMVLVFAFKRPLEELLKSAKNRKLILKVAGQEITMEEANEQQQRMIEDLQTQVLELRRRHDEKPTETKALSAAVRLLEEPTRKRRVLWVDDNPKNNSFLLKRLEERGFTVDLARSTDEGIGLFSTSSYLLVVSDMARQEDGKYNPTAGLFILQKIRQENTKIPIVIFTSPDSAQRYKEEAIEQGASGITSSITELWELIADSLVAAAAA
ncbi:response regulator [Sorangium sp. So ce429]